MQGCRAPGRKGGFATFAALVALVTLAASCGIADKQRDADVIRASAAALAARGTATVTISEQIKVVKRPPQQAAAAVSGLPTASALPAFTRVLKLDYAKRLVAGEQPAAAPGQPAEPVMFFKEGLFYLRRVRATAGTRPWLKLDIGSLYDERKRSAKAAFGNDVFNTAWVVDLLRGALTGSVERIGTEEIDGVTTTHFKVNYDWEKALKGMPDDRRKTIETALTLMGVPQRVVRGEAWVGTDGLPRRMIAKIRQARSSQEVIELQMTLDFSAIGEPVNIALPFTKDIATVGSVNAIVGAAFSPARSSPGETAP